jgi:hypothetical protein
MTGRWIFFDFNLPNGTTWFYFSFLLAVALFFKFSRVLSIRNWDVVTLFLLVPGFLLLQQAKPASQHPEKSAPKNTPKNTPLAVTNLVANGGGLLGHSPSLGSMGVLAQADEPGLPASNLLWFGYLWLLCGSAYFFVRCLLDLTLVSRPALAPNLSFGGLAWFAGALFICLIAVAYRPERTQGGQAPPPPKVVPAEKQNIPVGQTLTQRSFGYWLTTRTFAVLCHLAVVVGLIFIGYRHFQDGAAGMAAATFYLMLPYTGFHVGEPEHVWPMVLFLWAVATYRMPMVAGILLGLAAVYAYFPALTFPIWVSFYWRRGAGRFLAAFFLMVGLGLGLIGLVLMLQDGQPDTLARLVRDALSLPAWQPWRIPTTEGFWTGVHWAYRIPVFIAYLAFVIATACWPVPKNLAQVISLSAAVFIGIQFWYADQGGAYVLWYLPLLMLLVFRPNLSDRRPPPIQPETDWLVRLRRAAARLLARVFKVSEPLVRAH